MSKRFFWGSVVCIAVLVAGFASAPAKASIAGFNNLTGWGNINQSDAGAAPTYSPALDRLQLTNTAGTTEARSIFFGTPQPIGQFNASFVYTALNIIPAGTLDYGLCFVIQNSPSGTNALGAPGGGGLAYSGITKSVAISLELPSSPGVTGRYQNGTISGGAASVSPASLFAGHPMLISLSYNGSLLTETIQDTTNSALIFSTVYPNVNIPALVGGANAYVGFTASTLGFFNERADQYISSPQFSAVPEPATIGLLMISAWGMSRRRGPEGRNAFMR